MQEAEQSAAADVAGHYGSLKSKSPQAHNAAELSRSAAEGVRVAKAPAHVLETLCRHPDLLRLPLEPMHGWRSSPDEGGHSHCAFCAATIYRGDPVVGCYLEYVSTVFCPDCVRDNPELFREWLASRPG